MQKTNVITQLILEIKLTHYLSSLSAYPDMPDHTHLTCVAFMELLSHAKIQLYIYLNLFVRYCSLKKSCILIGLVAFGP